MTDVFEDLMQNISLDTEDVVAREVYVNEETVREDRSDDDLSPVGK